ncbi:hypothetical protein Pla52o_53740 [Novipirellula galeiformis]|uniref:Uncharacterized protein n=1 Tax=Novipirellula galeiformis TaxID=2528004 RepID=A0A5C6C2W9_9BACT|nr:hypothetical protein Pla52o_53740 [Novipirellula galeiformis]
MDRQIFGLVVVLQLRWHFCHFSPPTSSRARQLTNLPVQTLATEVLCHPQTFSGPALASKGGMRIHPMIPACLVSAGVYDFTPMLT